MRTYTIVGVGLLGQILLGWMGAASAQPPEREHAVPREHPRLLGSKERLQQLAQDRSQAYGRVVSVAREQEADRHAKLISLSLVAAIEGDDALARQAVDLAMELVNGPIRKGHVTFGHDLALAAIAYDLCYDAWTDAERQACIEYINATVDANVDSETHVFHNAWYGYKNWGIGLGCYATYYENDKAKETLDTLYEDYLTRAALALELAGAGGGWGEGYYIHYWLYEWLFFCEVAKHCEGIDLYAAAPEFYSQRAIASAFEMYPGIGIYGSRRSIPMGDGGGITFGGDRDKTLSARRMLVNRYRDDAEHRYIHAFNELTPRSGVGVYAYKDFLWRDETIPAADLSDYKLSHISTGPGYVYARSSWDDDATHFFFKCGDRFTAHQHLDVGHFMIYRHEELVSDGGYYGEWNTPHVTNYLVRSIAHNTILVKDPAETWPDIRAGTADANDGGQHHDWPHHNGAVGDPQQWERERDLYDIGDILAFEDQGGYLYVAGDCTRAYKTDKLRSWTRQIVYIRPGTFVVFDRVDATDPAFRKTWVLQAAKVPVEADGKLVLTNGDGRLFVQTLLPQDAERELYHGDGLYRYGGGSYPPSREPPGPVPECRVEVSPAEAATTDYFLHVLTATDTGVEMAPSASVTDGGDAFAVEVGAVSLAFSKDGTGGSITQGGESRAFADSIIPTASP